MKNVTEKGCTHQRHHGGRGPSSFWMHDSEVVFDTIQLTPGEIFLDMGCGPGDYAIKAAELVGHVGKVIAVDASFEMARCVSERAVQENMDNIETINADISRLTAVEAASVDICFLSTVLHIFPLEQVGESVFTEIRRVLKPGGRIAVIECKKEKMPFGPPLTMRMSAEEISEVASKYGFVEKGYVDLGYNYLICFVNE